MTGRWALPALVVVLAVHVPPFVCMPPDVDAVQWDVCVRTVFRGGALYRDAFENNLPGMLWCQGLVRATLGWRSEAIRLIDLAVVAGVVVLLGRWLPAGSSRLGLAVVLAGFYLGTSEWCHVQRDVWMMLPALLALRLRRRLIEGKASFVASLTEGAWWGLAVWIKPVVLIPALTAWAASAVLLRKKGRAVLADLGGLLAGGLAAGAGGLAWLAWSGSWADFWDVLLVWNREYAAHDYTEGSRLQTLLGVAVRFFPWPLAHLVAVPAAIDALRRGGRPVLLAALYLGWLTQALFVQHAFDYVHVPPLLLGLTVIALDAALVPARRGVLVAFLAACLVLRLGPLSADRLGVWGRCWGEGSSPALRDRLSLTRRVDWEALEGVRDYLRDNADDGEVSALTMHGLSFFLDPGFRPATRYFSLQSWLDPFRRQRERVLDAAAASRQRLLVVDVRTAFWKGRREPPPDARVVFERGPYRVYAVRGDETRAWVGENLEFR